VGGVNRRSVAQITPWSLNKSSTTTVPGLKEIGSDNSDSNKSSNVKRGNWDTNPCPFNTHLLHEMYKLKRRIANPPQLAKLPHSGLVAGSRRVQGQEEPGVGRGCGKTR
jgi:hypothetical protein